MYWRSFLIVLFLFLSTNLQAQDAYLSKEFSIANENDFYLFQESDRYYSNGLLIHYRWIPNKILQLDSIKTIFDIELSHKFYTPQDLLLTDVNDFDRPYAGMLYAGFNYYQYRRKHNRRSIGIDLGLVGQATGAEVFQDWYHSLVGFPDPRGWRYQIPNELFINIKGGFSRQYRVLPQKIDIVSSTDFSLGTAFTHVFQRVDLRAGKLQWFRNSAFSNALIGAGSEKITKQYYFFLGYGAQYVMQNITIDGSLWANDAPHTERSLPWVQHMRFGFASSTKKSTFKMTYNWLSPEVRGIRNHAYVSLELLLRFPSY